MHDYHSDKMQLFELHSSEMATFKIMLIPTGYCEFYLNGWSFVGPHTPPLNSVILDLKRGLEIPEVVWCGSTWRTLQDSSPIQTFSGE